MMPVIELCGIAIPGTGENARPNKAGVNNARGHIVYVGAIACTVVLQTGVIFLAMSDMNLKC